jgi:hypothetical protein
MSRSFDGMTLCYTAVVHKNLVKPVYVIKARKALKLTEEDGVSDQEFFSG